MFLDLGKIIRVKADSYGNEKLKRKWPKSVFFLEPKTWSESILWQWFCFGMVSTTSLSLSMRGRYNNEIGEWKWPPIFHNEEGEICKSRRAGALK